MIYARLREGSLIVLSSVAMFVWIALITHSMADPGWSHWHEATVVHNAAGKIGAWVSDFLFSLFGFVSHLIPFAMGYAAYLLYKPRAEGATVLAWPTSVWVLRGTGFLFALSAVCGLASIHIHMSSMPMSSGGLVGQALCNTMLSQLSMVGSSVILLAFFLAGMTLLTGMSWIELSKKGGIWSWGHTKKGYQVAKAEWQKRRAARLSANFAPEAVLSPWPRLNGPSGLQNQTTAIMSAPKVEPKLKSIAKLREMLKRQTAPAEVPERGDTGFGAAYSSDIEDYLEPAEMDNNLTCEMPSLSLLESADHSSEHSMTPQMLETMAQLVETQLSDFKIEGKVVAAHPGPVITRFEILLAPGIKVNRITTLVKDLARSLSVMSVRVVEVIAGKPTVGLEIPNPKREIVRLKEILETMDYQESLSPLTLGLGKDISGNPVAVDLTKMPHLLVAGTTGSGKSVGLNAMLLSILYKASPEMVRLIMIDPKMLELAIYEGIPHLLTPVVTDMKDAANALRWCVGEMERRYQIMAALGVRHIGGYNRKISEAQKARKPIFDPIWVPHPDGKPPVLGHMPYIVVVVDEFADLMMVVGKKVEELIARIAQKARAAGIHLILATQRPSVDVITGLIKANIPTRIAFQVSSKIDSRTILDQSGAEQLLGHGDMLYLPPGSGVPTRVHGAFVADEEVHKVVQDWRKRGKPNYIDSVVHAVSNPQERSEDDEDYDELYDEAVCIVIESRRASISHIQRRLKIGYNRAARMIECMETDGVVGPVQTNGTREVLAPPPTETAE